jgi:copper transport protein
VTPLRDDRGPIPVPLRRPRRRAPALAAAVLLARIGAPAPAAAAPGEAAPSAFVHAHLVSSSPADGDTVSAGGRLVLRFSEPIEAGLGEVTLHGWSGTRVALEALRDPGDVRSLLAELPPLDPGGYRAAWRIVSADGHPVSGTMVFYVAGSAAGSPVPAAPPAQAGEGAHHGEPAGATGEPPVAAVVARGLALGCLLGAAGLVSLLAWGVRQPPRRLERAAVALAAGSVLFLGVDLLLWAQHAAPAAGSDAGDLGAALASRSGRIGLVRVGLALLALWAVGLVRRPAVAAVPALGAIVLSAWTGHPAALSPAIAIPAKAVHLVAAALWLGGLLVLALGPGAPLASAADAGAPFRSDAARVSTVALWAVVAIAATGLVQLLLFLPSPADLVRSAYGFLSLGKVAGLAVLAGFGARNRFRLMPRLGGGASPAALRRSVTAEAGVMALVIVLAALLAYVPPPTDPPPGGLAGAAAIHAADAGGHP